MRWFAPSAAWTAWSRCDVPLELRRTQGDRREQEEKGEGRVAGH